MLNPRTGKKWKVYCAIPSTGEIHDFIPFVMRDLQDRYSDEIDLVFPENLCQRIFHDAARNGLVEDFLTTDCDIMWMLDSDVAPPKHILDLVSQHGDKWQAAGAPYPIFMAPPGESQRQIVFTVYKKYNDKFTPSGVPMSGTEFVDGLATGCLFLKREVFDKLERPWFEFKFDPITRQPIVGEDLGLCMRLSKLGVQFFTDYSMVCKHTKKVCLLEMNNYCLEFANRNVQNAMERYDKDIKGKIEILQAKMQASRKPRSPLILK
jgi:GT2 family glycosyltransferase